MTAPLVSFAGLASGFNYRDLVDAIIAQERIPATRLESEQAALSRQRSALDTYRGLLAAVKTAATTLRDGTAFDATTATTTISAGTRALATVSTGPGVTPGSVSLTVDQLARAAKYVATGVADASADLGTVGTFTVNGQAIDVTAGMSLADVRDAINATNSGSTPTGVTASILSVSATEQRLVLSSTATGATGLTIADTAGTVLQSLGLVDGLGDVPPAAVLQAGTDAIFRLDGILLTRSSNVVTDAIDGVTITLTAADAGAQTEISFGRFADTAKSALQGFTEAYNRLATFLREQGTAGEGTRPALYNDSLLRGLRRDLPSELLRTVFGAPADLATVGGAGLSLTRDGTLLFNAALFDEAYQIRQAELRALFSETRTASGVGVEFASAGGNPASGTYAVEIMGAATRATATTTGFGGVYDAGATPDSITIRNTASGVSTTVALTTGQTITEIRDAIAAATASAGVAVSVSVVGGELELTADDAGSVGNFTLEFTGLGDGAAELWNSDVAATGDNVTGTIGGQAATGAGNLLVGNAGTDVAGLSVRYTEIATGAVGSITLAVGTGAAVERLLDRYLDTGGSLDSRLSQIDLREQRITDRVNAVDTRLERRRATLLAQFLRMETSIARLQSVSQSFLSALTPRTGAA
jgi:flagellar hook-associated protein 2